MNDITKSARKGLSMIGANVMFALLFLVGAFMLVETGYEDAQTIAAASQPVANAIILLASVIVLGIVFSIASKLDRRCSEDYIFQLMANAALVGLVTMLMVNMFWGLDFLREAIGLREMRSDDLMAVAIMAWSIGFFSFRVRGLNP